MRTLDLVRAGGGRCLMILLPGRWDRPEAFRRAGFGAAVVARKLPIDLIAVDADLGYYRDRSVVERLHSDVVAPARAAGYETVWLGGISLGGVGTLFYLRDHPRELDGALALAPYLGEDELIRELTAAGGLERWRPPATIPGGDIGRELWSWIASWREAPLSTPLHLGWGTADRLAPANRLLATLLPPTHTYRADGAHDWRTWERLWEEFLDRAQPCAPVSP